MMSNLAQLYDQAFFREWGKGNEKYVDSAGRIVDFLQREFAPQRIVDAGCGSGVYGHFFRKHKVEVIEIDGVVPPPEHSFGPKVEIRDLTEPFENEWGEFDFALCLEVAEHIPKNLADAFLDNLCRLSDRLVLSAAPPNQGGTYHVNERPRRYWVRKLAARGFGYDKESSGRLQEHFKARGLPHMWMCLHIGFFDRLTETSARVLKDRVRTALQP